MLNKEGFNAWADGYDRSTARSAAAGSIAAPSFFASGELAISRIAPPCRPESSSAPSFSISIIRSTPCKEYMQRGERECFMRIAVFSDSHGVKEPMLAAIEEQKPDMVLHLGDYVRDAEAMAAYFPSLDLRYVRGNCDAYSRSDAEENLLFNADGVRIFMTHGHRYNVKLGYESLANAAHFSGAQLALFGHTHEADFLRMGDVTLFNPGSAGMGRQTYGMITVKGTEFKCEILSL